MPDITKSVEFDIRSDAKKEKVLYLLISCDLFLVGDMLHNIPIWYLMLWEIWVVIPNSAWIAWSMVHAALPMINVDNVVVPIVANSPHWDVIDFTIDWPLTDWLGVTDTTYPTGWSKGERWANQENCDYKTFLIIHNIDEHCSRDIKACEVLHLICSRSHHPNAALHPTICDHLRNSI